MKSIRRLLVTVLIGGNILVVGMGLFLGHKLIKDQLNFFFDSAKTNGAQLMTHMFSEALPRTQSNLPEKPRNENLNANNRLEELDHLRAQVTLEDATGGKTTLLYASHLGPMLEPHPGHHKYTLNGEDWKAYSLYDKKTGLRIILADRMQYRYRAADSMFIQLGLFLCIGFIMLTQIVSFAVYYSFKPIKQFAQALGEKKADDLSPLRLDDTPQEIIPLVNSSNDLLLRLKEALERESRFSADVAHELRNPLAGIRVNLENILEETTKHSESAVLLQQGVARMQNIVEQMLILHRIAPDTFLAKFDEIDLGDIVANVLRQLKASIDAKRHQVSVTCNNSMMKGERHTIEILIRNLLVNSIKYCPPASRIHVGIYNQDDSMVLEIMDSGPGIPEHERVHIFRRFYRSGGDRHASGIEGCGLGLSIVEKIAKLHQCVVSISDSIFATGVSVKVVFPKQL